MRLVKTKYKAFLLMSNGEKIANVDMIFDGVYKVGKEAWAKYFEASNKCSVDFFDEGKDAELYRLGFFKIAKIERVDVYEERTTEMNLDWRGS